MEDQFDYDAPDVNPFGKAFSSDITGDGPRTKLVVLGVACVAVPFAMVGIGTAVLYSCTHKKSLYLLFLEFVCCMSHTIHK